MENLHDMVKHFSSTIYNRKNCNDMLEHSRFLSANQLEQDRNRTRKVAA